MNNKILLEELSCGSNFGTLRAIGSNRFWCYLLVHTFKIKNRFESILSNGSRDIAKSLKISFGSSFVSFRNFDSQYTSFKQKKLHSIIFTRSSGLVYTTFADGRTNGQTFSEKVLFFPPDQEYICMSISISIIFQISPPS